MRNLRAERATDVAALADNARSIARAAGGREVIAVVKADAYGNGLVRCARALKGEAAMFAVATASEAKRLLDAKICLPVLIMGTLSKDELRAAALLDGASLAVSSLAEAACLDRLAAAAGRRIPVHIAVDSGMHRFGFAPDPKTIGLVATFRGVVVEGIYTHYARSDDDAFTRRQCDVFCDVVEKLKARGMNFRFVHAAASGADTFSKTLVPSATPHPSAKTAPALFHAAGENSANGAAAIFPRAARSFSGTALGRAGTALGAPPSGAAAGTSDGFIGRCEK